MSRVIKFSVSGNAAETDAPSVEDALDQIKDYLNILRGVENAVSEDNDSAIVWRIVGASRASPLTFAVEPFPKQYATNIDQRADLVIKATASGLRQLEQSSTRPDYFTDDVLRSAHRVFARVTNGLTLSEANFGEELPKSSLTASLGRAGERNIALVLQPTEKLFEAIGSVEGYLQAAELDGFNRKVIHLKTRVTGNLVKCLLSNAARSALSLRQMDEIFSYRRVVAFGRIHYKSLTKISFIETRELRFLRSRADLPKIDDIIDPDFTGGIRSEDYLSMVRNADHH